MRPRPIAVLGLALLAACGGGEPEGEPIEFTIPSGASFDVVVDSLRERSVVRAAPLFALYARMRGADRQVRAGRYRFAPGSSWKEVLGALVEGRVLTEAVTVPEGLTLDRIAERIAPVSGVSQDSVLAILTADSAAERFGLPGPGLEGFLLPETYRFAPGTSPDRVIAAMAEAYRAFWTDERMGRLDHLGMTMAELTTLASIVQAEARHQDEMPLIAAVYHNRLREGWPLQADPTVLYALGGHRSRLLYAAMDSVADHPYNTYTRAGLPPGPIGAPGPAALHATLHPAESDFMFFVAVPGGRHLFSRTLAEHNRAVSEARRQRDTTPPPGDR
jgi:UPF0755 protein